MRTSDSVWQITGGERRGRGREGDRQGGGRLWEKINLEHPGRDGADRRLGGPKAESGSSGKKAQNREEKYYSKTFQKCKSGAEER